MITPKPQCARRPRLIVHEESSSSDESTDDEGNNRRPICLRRCNITKSVTRDEDNSSSDTESSDDKEADERKEINNPRTVRRRRVLPDGYLYGINKKRGRERRPSAPAAVSSRPKVYGPQVRPITQKDVEQHRCNVLYDAVDTLTDVNILFVGLTYGGFNNQRKNA